MNLAVGGAVLLPPPADAHEHIIAIAGARKGDALPLCREQAHARAAQLACGQRPVELAAERTHPGADGGASDGLCAPLHDTRQEACATSRRPARSSCTPSMRVFFSPSRPPQGQRDRHSGAVAHGTLHGNLAAARPPPPARGRARARCPSFRGLPQIKHAGEVPGGMPIPVCAPRGAPWSPAGARRASRSPSAASPPSSCQPNAAAPPARSAGGA